MNDKPVFESHDDLSNAFCRPGISFIHVLQRILLATKPCFCFQNYGKDRSIVRVGIVFVGINWQSIFHEQIAGAENFKYTPLHFIRCNSAGFGSRRNESSHSHSNRLAKVTTTTTTKTVSIAADTECLCYFIHKFTLHPECRYGYA